MTRLQSFLERACNELGLRIVAPYFLTIREGVQINALALLPDLGASKGMIVVKDFVDLGSAGTELPIMGYGYSVFSEPLTNDSYDLDSYVELFSDWGWGNVNERKPDWMI